VTLDAVATGGQAGTSPRIENYLGFPSGVSGAELTDRAVIQAQKFGALISVPAEATALEQRDGQFVVRLMDGTAVAGRTILIATGARYRKLPIPPLEEFEGTSVYYAATEVEAQMCRTVPVAVVGGGNSAGQATVFLTRYAEQFRLLIRGADLGKSMSRYLADQIERSPGVDNRGFILTGAEAARSADGGAWRSAGRARRQRFPLETSWAGVFAAGDVRSGSIKRVASAVGEGAMAVRLVHEHLESTEASGPGGSARRPPG
jgi:thioredoxin reductase (NADPH)